jgi:hypothetical protein
MKDFSTDGIELRVAKSSDFGALPVAPALDVKRLLYFLLLIPALMASLLPLGIYPPLDSRLPMGLIICVFLLSAVLQLMSIVQRQPVSQVGWRRTVYIGSGLALPLLGILLFMNGKLDRFPSQDVSATVIHKVAPIGYREAQYHLIVSSWRPGRSFEDLNVNSREFESAVVGKRISVEMHKGSFGLPWHGRISPE